MNSMARININSFDLNLLVAIDALMQERNVTRAGACVGLSQPSMSNALARMRKVGRTTRAQIVHANNLVALRKQSVDKGGADESGSTGDQDTHFTTPFPNPD